MRQLKSNRRVIFYRGNIRLLYEFCFFGRPTGDEAEFWKRHVEYKLTERLEDEDKLLGIG